jgi:hydrogenase maturation protein HypF
MELEAMAAEAGHEEGFYPTWVEEGRNGSFVIRTTEIIKTLVEDLCSGIARENCAARFHNSTAYAVLEGCGKIRARTGLSTVALSGGVFANSILTEKLTMFLVSEGYEVLTNSLVPAGDGGVSLGQAAVAAWRLQCA